jgi:acyl carrier protein phosphodiesterase
MNFLSHLYLSGDDTELLIGNYIADAVKGSEFKKYPEGVQRGILLHRSIDTFTDTHPVVDTSKQRLRPRYRKYAPVIVDIYYDHFLAVEWQRWHHQPLHDFSSAVYAILEQHRELLPFHSQRFLHYMRQYDILAAYSNIGGIQQVFNGMASRTTFESGMDNAVEELQSHYENFAAEFNLFFPDLREHVENVLKTSR